MIPLQTNAIKAACAGIARRVDGDYSDVLFPCPTNGRDYVSVRPPIVHEDLVAPYVSTACYWCDTERRLRGDPGFNRDAPQPHGYLLAEVAHAHEH
jgi:hypothetical protein